jgi:hypothetical protein
MAACDRPGSQPKFDENHQFLRQVVYAALGSGFLLHNYPAPAAYVYPSSEPSTSIYAKNPRFGVPKFFRFGKMPVKSESGTPNQEANVAPY